MWTVEGRGDTFAIVDEIGSELATVPYPDDAVGEPLDSAEGRRAVLLSVAPELLAACQAALAVCEAESEMRGEYDSDDYYGGSATAVTEMLQEVLRKVEF